MAKTSINIEASTTGKKGTIRLVDFISMVTDSSAEHIRTIVDGFLKEGITDTEVYINSRGGSTVEAVEIANELYRLPKVSLTIGAVAASAATYLMTKFRSQAFTNSQFMIHAPKLNAMGDINKIEADLKLLRNTTEDYKKAYAIKTGKSIEEIEAVFAKGDYWMTSEEAKTFGLLDKIIEQEQKLTAQDCELLVACAAPVIPNIEKPEIKMKNKNQIIAKLKLSADATDEQIEAAVANAMEKADKVEALQRAQADAVKANAEAMVDKAILDKKITADVKDKYVKLAENDMDNTKAILEAMQSVGKISGQLDPSASDMQGREKWTMEDYQEKDPEALATMMVNAPEKFKKLETDYFGK